MVCLTVNVLWSSYISYCNMNRYLLAVLGYSHIIKALDLISVLTIYYGTMSTRFSWVVLQVRVEGSSPNYIMSSLNFVT